VKFRTQIPDATNFRAACAEYKKKPSHPDGNQNHLSAVQSVPTETTPKHEQLN